MGTPDHKRTRPTFTSRLRAQQLRSASTPPEKVLWEKLRGGRIDGWKFRRQHALGPFIADFYCQEAALVVEIDGMSHFLRGKEDEDRDQWMSSRGISTLRLSAKQVLANIDSALHLVKKELAGRVHKGNKAPSPDLEASATLSR